MCTFKSEKKKSLESFLGRILISVIPGKSHLVPGSPVRKVTMMCYEITIIY